MKNNSVRCDVCKIDLHRGSYSRHLKSKKHMENMTQSKVIIPKKNWIKRIVKEEIKVSDIDTKDENRYYFTDRILKDAYGINIDNHHNENANSTITITSKFNNIGIDINHIKKIMEEMSYVYAKFINQYNFKYQLTFLVLFNKSGEDNEITSEIELPITLSNTHNLTQSQIDNINIRWDLENRIQSIEMKESGWNFQRINTMGISFYKSGELNRSSYVKVPLRSSAILNIENNDKYCFLWSILASLHPCNITHPSRVLNYKNNILMN